MNKWMKHGMLGLALTSATASVATTAKSEMTAKPSMSQEVMVDAIDLIAGGSKLKDRRIQNAIATYKIEMVRLEKIQG